MVLGPACHRLQASSAPCTPPALGGLLLYGLPRAVALSAALVYQATMFVTLVLAGLGCLLAESMLAGRRLKLTALVRASATSEPGTP